MTNSAKTKAILEQEMQKLNDGKVYMRENSILENFNTTFESKGTSTDNSSDIFRECGTRVGVFFLRDGKKEFYRLNNELSTKNFQFTAVSYTHLTLPTKA